MLVKIKWLYANYLCSFVMREGIWKHISGNYYYNRSVQCKDVFHNVMQVRNVTTFNGAEYIAVFTRARNSALSQDIWTTQHLENSSLKTETSY